MTQNTLRPDLTIELKAKFNAQYWHQKVLRADYANETRIVGHYGYIVFSDQYLLLTSLSDITDEDAKELAKIGLPDKILYDHLWSSGTGKQIASSILHGRQNNSFYPHFRMGDAFDFLRSRGYALPWLGYSVDELIEAGYLVLKKGAENEHSN